MYNEMIILMSVILIGIVGASIFTNRKGKFEKGLTYHTLRYLPQKRQEYMEKAKQYVKVMSIVIGLFISIPSIIVFTILLLDINIPIILLFILFMIVVNVLIIYLMYCLFMRGIKKQQVFLEQMSDDEFLLLLRINKRVLFPKYFLPFILCKDRLYFQGTTIKEFDPSDIKEVDFYYSRGGNIIVHIRSLKSISITIYENLYPILIEIIKKYNPDVRYKTLK
jgi:hypothetical protein